MKASILILIVTIWMVTIAFDRVIPIITAIDFDRLLEGNSVGKSVPMSAYGLRDGDRVGHRLEFDLIGEVCEGTTRVRLGPHPATDNEIREVTPNAMVSIGRRYHFVVRKGYPDDPAPNRYAYNVALYSVADSQKRTLKSWASEKSFEDSPEGQARMERDRLKLKSQFIHSIDKIIAKKTEIDDRYDILCANFLTLTGHELTGPSLEAYRSGTLEKPAIESTSSEEPSKNEEPSIEVASSEEPSKAPKASRSRSRSKASKASKA